MGLVMSSMRFYKFLTALKILTQFIDKYSSLALFVGFTFTIGAFHFFYGGLAQKVESQQGMIDRLIAQDAQRIHDQIDVISKRLEEHDGLFAQVSGLTIEIRHMNKKLDENSESIRALNGHYLNELRRLANSKE